MADMKTDTLSLVKLACALFTVGLYCAPLPLVLQIRRLGTSENAALLPLLMMFVQCALWGYYGFMLPDDLIVKLNGVGAVLAAGYCYMHHRFAPRTFLIRLAFVLSAGLLVGVVIYVERFADPDVALPHLAMIAIVATVAMFGAPLATIRRVLAERTGYSISPLMASLQLASTCSWALYGSLTGDSFIVVPNGAGAMLAVAQLALVVVFGTKAPVPQTTESGRRIEIPDF